MTVSPITNRNEKGTVPMGTIVYVTPQAEEPKIHKDRADARSSTYKAFTAVDDNMLSPQERDAPTTVCIDDRPMLCGDLKGGRHCIPSRPISEDILGAPWMRKPIAMKLGSASAPNSPLSTVKLQRVSPQRARIFPPDFPNPIQRPVAQRQARRIADPKTGTGSNSTSMHTYDPWIKGPELKPVTNVTEILTMETNVDGNVAKTSWSPYFQLTLKKFQWWKYMFRLFCPIDFKYQFQGENFKGCFLHVISFATTRTPTQECRRRENFSVINWSTGMWNLQIVRLLVKMCPLYAVIN